MRMIICLLLFILMLFPKIEFSQNWLPVGEGVGCYQFESVRKLLISEDGSELYLSGIIMQNGGCEQMRGVLKYGVDGIEEVVTGTMSATVNDIFEYNATLYCSGFLVNQTTSVSNDFNYHSEDNIWDTVPNGIYGGVFDHLIIDGNVYLAGAFTKCGNQPCSYVCTYNGNQVLPYYSGPMEDDMAFAIDLYNDTLFVGGNFTSQPGELSVGYNNCCKLVNGEFEKVSSGFYTSGVVKDLEVFQNKLFMAGYCQPIGFTSAHTIYYYENGQIYSLPQEPNYRINTLKTYNGGLYVAGDFDHIGDQPCYGVARWDGEIWTCLSNEPVYYQNNQPCTMDCFNDMEFWNDTLYIGGSFGAFGSQEAKRLAKLDLNLSEAFPLNMHDDYVASIDLSISPNPTRSTTLIQSTQKLPMGTMVLFTDAAGKQVLSHRLNTASASFEVDVSSLESGLYLCSVQYDNVFYKAMKVLKE